MTIPWTQYFAFFLKIVTIGLFVGPFFDKAHALAENFDLYEPPQALAMGNAFTADASGYVANYYNPAGLARLEKTKPEIVVVDWELITNANALGRAYETKTLGAYRQLGKLAASAGEYTFFKTTSVPAYTRRGFSVSLLGSYLFAGESDGTTLDVNARTDVGLSVGLARNFAGNVIKLGISGKYLLRNELNGQFAHADIPETDDGKATLMKSGAAAGFDLGALITLPSKWLPTLGIAWKDVLGTHFTASSLLNNRASGVPAKIPQTVNAAVSVRPWLGKRFRGTFAAEFKRIERTDLALRKRLHFGVQLEDQKSLYVWAGMNQLYPTLGFGLRVKGGNLEIGSSASDIGVGEASESDRRYFVRYTISF